MRNIKAGLLFLAWVLPVCLALYLCPVRASIIQEASTLGLTIYDVSVSGVGYHSAIIRWRTNVPATSQVFYGTRFQHYIENYGYHTPEDDTPVTEHSQRLDGLREGTTYHFRVRSVTGSTEAVSGDATFHTLRRDTSGSSGGQTDTEPEETPYLIIELNEDTTAWPIAANGHLLTAVDVTSLGDEISIHIPDDTCCLNPNHECLYRMLACCEGEIVDSCRACLRDTSFLMLGDIYDIGPSGSTFDPYADITLTYNEPQIPAGITENDLCIGWCHGDEWVPLDSIVNATANTVSARITHLSAFTILGQPSIPPSPAEFVLSNLDINPAEAAAGETVTVTVTVENTGGSEGTFPVNLWIDEIPEATQNVTLAPGGTETVIFTLSRSEAGVYSVVVSDCNGYFTVRAVTPSPSAPGATNPRNNWWWLIIIAAGIIIFIVARRRKRRSE